MKVAIVYNRESNRVINLFGVPNREKYGLEAIKRISDALKKGGHQVKSFEGDKELIDKLEHFMPRLVKGERPGIVLNLSYGIQGQARYTHVPSILEMVGIPYVGSGPLAHSLALDKVITKMIFQQHRLPTPDFAVLESPDFDPPDLPYPLITKPKNEAVSFGIKIVNNEEELREAAAVIFDQFQQPVLIERYIEGREVNVGLLGNGIPDVFPPVELTFGEGGPNIYTVEDKKGKTGKRVQHLCPAPLGDELTFKAQELALKAFKALECYDCARVDMRIDAEGNLYLLEINSLPSLGARGSYVIGAESIGLDFSALVNRLVEVAGARYFGTPSPPPLSLDTQSPESTIFTYLTSRRDQMEERLRKWVHISSRTGDPVGLLNTRREMEKVFNEVKLYPAPSLSDDHSVSTWQTKWGVRGGTLLIAHLDVPLEGSVPFQPFFRSPEFLYGEGIGLSRSPLVIIEYVLRALRHAKMLNKQHLGILLYSDEGKDCRYSNRLIETVAERAKQVIVLRPIIGDDGLVIERRGQRKYRFMVEGTPRRVDKSIRKQDAFRWASQKLIAFADLSSPEKRLSVATTEIHTKSYPTLLPHRITATVLMTYAKPKTADETEQQMRQMLAKEGFRFELDLLSDRPPLPRRRIAQQAAKGMAEVASRLDLSLQTQSSALPSVAGLVPASVPVLCGLGPVARDLYTPKEAISRIGLLQRALILSQYLIEKK
ncbi:ATP-grasp domain-containing protein [bacterium]|nr:ATP-grasp domain-containing protein [bacterium]